MQAKAGSGQPPSSDRIQKDAQTTQEGFDPTFETIRQYAIGLWEQQTAVCAPIYRSWNQSALEADLLIDDRWWHFRQIAW